ncbi:MAG: 5'-nucleotidase [Verrucomicrobia bacterium]|nr:5'-nucleotidase [Verrucomicrobiota bacterium]
MAFDGDAVLFSGASEKIFKEQGLEAFLEFEKKNAKKPLPDGPFAKLLRMLHFVQKQYQLLGEDAPIRTALVTARNAPSHERVIRTLRAWGVNIDETFFMGGVAKTKILQAFKPHIFFDDQLIHCQPVADLIPTGNVPTNDY